MVMIAIRHWRIIAGGLALIAAFAAGWHVQGLRCDSKLAKIERQAVEARESLRAQMEAAATDYETFRAGNEAAETQTRERIREIYRNVEVPADCALGPDAVRLLDEARIRANEATGQSGSAVQDDPGAD